MSCDCELDLKNYVTVDYPSEKLKPIAQAAYDFAISRSKIYKEESNQIKKEALDKYDNASKWKRFWMQNPREEMYASWSWSIIQSGKMLDAAEDFKKVIDLCDVSDMVRISGDALKRLTHWAGR